MSDSVQNPSSTGNKAADTPMGNPEQIEKGKGKMAEDPMDDDDEDESQDDEDQGEVEEPDEDNMEEIDQDNIMGRRTRGKNIDFAQAAKEMDDNEEDEDDDDDFEDPDNDKMEE